MVERTPEVLDFHARLIGIGQELLGLHFRLRDIISRDYQSVVYTKPKLSFVLKCPRPHLPEEEYEYLRRSYDHAFSLVSAYIIPFAQLEPEIFHRIGIPLGSKKGLAIIQDKAVPFPNYLAPLVPSAESSSPLPSEVIAGLERIIDVDAKIGERGCFVRNPAPKNYGISRHGRVLLMDVGDVIKIGEHTQYDLAFRGLTFYERLYELSKLHSSLPTTYATLSGLRLPLSIGEYIEEHQRAWQELNEEEKRAAKPFIAGHRNVLLKEKLLKALEKSFMDITLQELGRFGISQSTHS